jgi:hypothetical protein
MKSWRPALERLSKAMDFANIDSLRELEAMLESHEQTETPQNVRNVRRLRPSGCDVSRVLRNRSEHSRGERLGVVLKFSGTR